MTNHAAAAGSRRREPERYDGHEKQHTRKRCNDLDLSLQVSLQLRFPPTVNLYGPRSTIIGSQTRTLPDAGLHGTLRGRIREETRERP